MTSEKCVIPSVLHIVKGQGRWMLLKNIDTAERLVNCATFNQCYLEFSSDKQYVISLLLTHHDQAVGKTCRAVEGTGRDIWLYAQTVLHDAEHPHKRVINEGTGFPIRASDGITVKQDPSLEAESRENWSIKAILRATRLCCIQLISQVRKRRESKVERSSCYVDDKVQLEIEWWETQAIDKLTVFHQVESSTVSLSHVSKNFDYFCDEGCQRLLNLTLPSCDPMNAKKAAIVGRIIAIQNNSSSVQNVVRSASRFIMELRFLGDRKHVISQAVRCMECKCDEYRGVWHAIRLSLTQRWTPWVASRPTKPKCLWCELQTIQTFVQLSFATPTVWPIFPFDLRSSILDFLLVRVQQCWSQHFRSLKTYWHSCPPSLLPHKLTAFWSISARNNENLEMSGESSRPARQHIRGMTFSRVVSGYLQVQGREWVRASHGFSVPTLASTAVICKWSWRGRAVSCVFRTLVNVNLISCKRWHHTNWGTTPCPFSFLNLCMHWVCASSFLLFSRALFLLFSLYFFALSNITRACIYPTHHECYKDRISL